LWDGLYARQLDFRIMAGIKPAPQPDPSPAPTFFTQSLDRKAED
jgi:hypothetical protein